MHAPSLPEATLPTALRTTGAVLSQSLGLHPALSYKPTTSPTAAPSQGSLAWPSGLPQGTVAPTQELLAQWDCDSAFPHAASGFTSQNGSSSGWAPGGPVYPNSPSFPPTGRPESTCCSDRAVVQAPRPAVLRPTPWTPPQLPQKLLPFNASAWQLHPRNNGAFLRQNPVTVTSRPVPPKCGVSECRASRPFQAVLLRWLWAQGLICGSAGTTMASPPG